MGSCFSHCDSVQNNGPGHEEVLCFKPEATTASDRTISCTAEVLAVRRQESDAATNELIATPSSQMSSEIAKPFLNNVQTDARSHDNSDRTSNAVAFPIPHFETDGHCEPVAATRKEKEPRLKTDEMRLIFLRLPTSELVKFISNKSSPLGKYWFAAAQAVIETRLPFAISLQPYPALVDCNRDRIGWVKDYKGFPLSPLCHLIEEVSFYAYIDGQFLFIEVGYLLPSLVNLRNLKIHIQEKRPYGFDVTKLTLTRDNLANQSLVPFAQLRSARMLADADCVSQADCTKLSQIIACMTNVSQLHLSCNIFRAATCVPEAAAIIAKAVELEYECHKFRCTASNERVNSEFIAARCSGLRKLRVRGGRRETLPLFPAMRGLANLATLDLLAETYARGFTERTIEKNVTSVTELKLFEYSFDETKFMAFISKFPNIQQLQLICEYNAAGLLSSLGQLLSSGITAQLQKLTLGSYGDRGQRNELAGEELIALLGGANLPKVLDLSDIAFVRTSLCQDFLARLFNVMRGNSVEYLSLRAYVAPSDLASFKRVLPPGGKVVAWRADAHKVDYEGRVCVYSPEYYEAEWTDYQITGAGTNGKTFEIRFFSEVKQHTLDFQFFSKLE